MSKIRILPEQLANQIAAGEVIERPASVVKELVENSLDANASRIEIEIEGGGTRLIRIIDDGEGMAEDDLLLSLERHGTSKIKTQEDLTAITTLGFRGEALPSIGSVAKLGISSRTAGASLGARVQLEYGKLVKVHEIGCGFGTTSDVQNLFGNTPARRKFLRTARTELGHIEEVIRNYALASPEVTFLLKIDGRIVLNLDGSRTIDERLGDILHFHGTFIPIEGRAAGASGPKLVHGLIVPPELVTLGPARLRVFVNGRTVRDRMIVHAVTEGLRGFLLKGKNPAGLVQLNLPPQDIDVNVHPAKHEIRFRDGREVHTLVVQAVEMAMRRYQQTVRTSIFGGAHASDREAIPLEPGFHQNSPGKEEVCFEDGPGESLVQETGEKPVAPDAPQPFPERREPLQPRPLPTSSRPVNWETAGRTASETDWRTLLTTAEPIVQTRAAVLDQASVKIVPKSPSPRPASHNLIVIGQYDDLYIFCQSSSGLVVIDQHAAHERLLFEKLRKQYLAGTIARQILMFPETVELSPYQIQIIEKYQEQIDKMGFNLREFGGNTYIISAVPALTVKVSPRDLFFDTLEKFGREQTASTETGGIVETVLATMACKAAVKAGTRLSLLEIDSLLAAMAEADLFSHCPHGRPVVRQFSRDEIKKWFYRT